MDSRAPWITWLNEASALMGQKDNPRLPQHVLRALESQWLMCRKPTEAVARIRSAERWEFRMSKNLWTALSSSLARLLPPPKTPLQLAQAEYLLSQKHLLAAKTRMEYQGGQVGGGDPDGLHA